MYLACSSESYVKELDAGRLTLPDWLRLAAEELGLKAVELEDKHMGSPTPQRLAAVRAAADRYGLEIVNIALMNNFGLADDARRAAEQSRTLAWIDASLRLRTRFLRSFPGWPEGDRSRRANDPTRGGQPRLELAVGHRKLSRRAPVDRLLGAPRQTRPRQIYEDLLRWPGCARGSQPGVPLAACERLHGMCVRRV